MINIPTAESEAQDAQLENKESAAHKRVIAPQKSREPFFGAVLFAFMILFVVASIGGIGHIAYQRWQNEREAESRSSIVELFNGANEETNNVVPTEVTTPLDDKTPDETVKSDGADMAAAKKMEITVLNGGTAKGGAGVLADFLKKEGYLKTDMGNALKDYVGVTIYYAADLEKLAEVIRKSVVKKYSQVKILPADKTNKETLVSQVTIILGK
jgi:Na+-transporting methylmalonyl-CoA/oxaloacetate decarboxylase gamma subunit